MKLNEHDVRNIKCIGRRDPFTTYNQINDLNLEHVCPRTIARSSSNIVVYTHTGREGAFRAIYQSH